MESRHGGFSLFELLIAIAVIGIVSAFAIPAYRSYVETANMTKVTANFEQAIRVAQNAYNLQKTRAALGMDSPVPTTTDEWIALFNESGIEAPGGGPAYIASTNNRDTGRGDPVTGAIGVQFQPYREARTRRNGTVRPARDEQLQLWRPMYKSLREQRATISSSSIDVINQRQP
jgi:prepilin-type N-terminal cleavage/methylation domain-containing protein